jgi:integrase/recombinase XerD
MSAAFHSPLARDLQAFVMAKQAVGRKYDWAERRLRSFDRVVTRDVAEHGGGEVSLERVIARWLSPSGRRGTDIRVDSILARQFCLFRQRRDGGGYVPEHGLVRPTYRFRPYIFSSDQIRRLLRETQTLRGPNAPLRRATFRTLLLVLYCTGLRPGEPLRLTLADVDLRQQLFAVRESKGKTRLVPFRADLARQLRKYLELRLTLEPLSPQSPFFLRPDGAAYKMWQVSYEFRHLCRSLGLKPFAGRVGPRVYDVRHVFAVQRLTQWYRDGVDLQGRLPWLSAYMGHDNLLGTQVYLTATPELLRLASRRFAARFQGGTRR